MDYDKFQQRVCQPLIEKLDSFDMARVEGFYKDLLRIYEMAETVEASLVDSSASGDFALSKKRDKLVHQRLQITTLLKALYLLADVFIIVLLHEALERPAPSRRGTGLSLNHVINNNRLPLSHTAILPAYCVVSYRNVLIAHHDYQRMEGFTTSNENAFCLCPAPPNLAFPPGEVPVLEKLWEQYNLIIPQKEGLRSDHQRLWALFYKIPIDDKQEREEVNRLVERVGCQSMTRYGLLDAIDQFALEVVEAVRKK